MHSRSRITVCVPVFRPGRLLVDTLSSIQRQTYDRFHAVMSIDANDGDSAALCERFVTDRRFRVIIQPRRLGWVGNTNTLLAHVNTELFCLHPHDDLMHETYLETLCEELDRAPQAVTAFADIRMQGEAGGRTYEGVLAQASLVGGPVERQRRLLTEQLSAVAWRGLTRARVLPETGPMRINAVDNFAEDTVWMAQLARAGELHRVPEVLYVKRYHSRMTHIQWWAWPMEKKLRAWLIHCHEMLAEALPVTTAPFERLTLWRAAVSRLLNPGAHFGADIGALDRSRRIALLGRFVRRYMEACLSTR